MEADPASTTRNPLSIGRFAGIPIRFHWTFFLLVPLVVMADASGGPSLVLWGLLWIVALFASVVVHEIAHCIVARKRGSHVRDIVLFPLGGVSEIDALPEKPSDELAVAIVGPLTSLALGLALLGLGLLVGVRIWPPSLFAGDWLARLGWLNLLLAAFNMVPALPMDGGRVLRALLARDRPRAQATVVAARIGRWIGLSMIVIGFVLDFWLILIGIFVILGANAEESSARQTPFDRPPASGPHLRSAPDQERSGRM